MSTTRSALPHPMTLLVLGRGKTGTLVAEIAAEHRHTVSSLASNDNTNSAALTRESLATVDAVIDFTTPAAVMANVHACVTAGTNIVVGTTGWYGELERVRRMVEEAGTGFVYAANFSVGVNLFVDIARTASAALEHGYSARIAETHHVHKKDAPSGTALMLQRSMAEGGAPLAAIESVREGEVVGTHIVTLQSAGDTITLTHEAHSRRGFAEGAVLAAEWLRGRQGFYEWGAVLRAGTDK